VGKELLADGLRLLLALGADAEAGVTLPEVNGEFVEMEHQPAAAKGNLHQLAMAGAPVS
jgi:hypothetical protein